MPRFAYKVRDGEGNPRSGVVEAPAKDIAIDTLRDRGFFIISVDQEKEKGLLNIDLEIFNRIPVKTIVVFARQLSVLMGAQVPLVKAMRAVVEQTQHPYMRSVVHEIADDVESGTALSVSMAKYPKAFSDFFISMVRSGETTGRLEEIMTHLADQMEEDYDLMQRIRGAMIYPAFIVAGLVIVGFIMMAFVVPKLTEVLRESGAELPLATRILIAVSGFFGAYAIHIIVLTVALGALGVWWSKKPKGKRILDRMVLSIPVFGPLVRTVCVVRFTRTFGTMLVGGIDVPGALSISADVVGNAYFHERIEETRFAVQDGSDLASVFARDPFMPAMVTQMISVGEDTGKLHDVLARLTSFYSRELKNNVANLVSAIEPLIMMIMGVAVGIMVAAIILPMYNLAAQF